MGQVALDLPDPLNSSSPAGPGVDDLLAQLAGEEIDRLLAEADVERPARTVEVIVPLPEVIVPPSAKSAAPPPVATATVSNLTLAPSAADPAQSHIELEPAMPSGPIVEADVDELDARVAQELNSLFSELDGEKPKAAAGPVAAPAPVAPVAPAAPIEVPTVAAPAIPAAPSDPVAQAQALEKQLMGKALLDALGGPGEAESATGGLKSINLSVLLRPLEWVNAPLAAASDASRETMGKVAIMTLINALAVLLYVLFVRRH
jgi:hypothetical protein